MRSVQNKEVILESEVSAKSAIDPEWGEIQKSYIYPEESDSTLGVEDPVQVWYPLINFHSTVKVSCCDVWTEIPKLLSLNI